MLRLIILLLTIMPLLTLHGQSSGGGGIGLYAGANFSSFSRSATVPSNPFSEASVLGYDIGLYFPIVKKNYEFILTVGYSEFGGNETFQFQDNAVETQLTFRSARASLLPLTFKIGGEHFKVLFGAGGYINYVFGQNFTSTPEIDPVFPDDLFNPIIYGVQGRVGLTYKTWRLSLDGLNSMNDLIAGTTETQIITRSASLSLTKILGANKIKETSEIKN